MKTNTITGIALLLITPALLLAQTTKVITPQPIGNLFDGNLSTNWISSFNGEKFPIDLEVQFESTETVFEVMLRQVTTASNLEECQVADFDIYIKQPGKTIYPEQAVYSGTMETGTNTRQWFTLAQATTGDALLIRINKLSGSNTFHAALNELGIRSSRKNGTVASISYNLNNPGTWSGISWTNEQPYQVQAINWLGKTQMTGDFNLSLFEKLNGNYDFRNTQINVISRVLSLPNENEIKVSPTMTKQILNISSSHTITGVEVVNLLGQRFPFEINTKSIDISTLSNGHYILIIETDKGQFKTKIIKY